MVVSPVWRAEFHVVTELPETERGSNGFGSTGVAL
jgi:dUTPase